MTRWLWIEGSPRGERSRSSALARAFLGDRAHTRLNVWEADLPPLDQPAVEARYAVLAGEADPAQLAQWSAIRALFDHVHAHDAYVISSPMWNWGIPYRLKHLIDCLTQPGLAFTADTHGVTGLFAAKRAVLLTTSALPYEAETASLDHQRRYLEHWLDFIGLVQRTGVHAAPMYGAPEVVERAFARALAGAVSLGEAA